MGVGQQSHALYYSIYDGKICKRVAQPTKDSKERTNKSGKQVHEEFFGYIDGVIKHIYTREPPKDKPQFGKSWIIGLEDEGTMQFLQMPYSGGPTSAFLKMLPNIDLAETVKIIPSKKVVDGKDKTSLFITQDGHAIKWAWSKDSPGELPPLEKKTVKGQIMWDDYDQMQYLEAYVTEHILPLLNQKAIDKPSLSEGSNSGMSTPPIGAADILEPIDDLPF